MFLMGWGGREGVFFVVELGFQSRAVHSCVIIDDEELLRAEKV